MLEFPVMAILAEEEFEVVVVALTVAAVIVVE